MPGVQWPSDWVLIIEIMLHTKMNFTLAKFVLFIILKLFNILNKMIYCDVIHNDGNFFTGDVLLSSLTYQYNSDWLITFFYKFLNKNKTNKNL